MKKMFFSLLSILFSSLLFAQGGGHAPADTRVITKCGFTSSWGALIAREKEGVFAGPGESEVTTTNLAPDLNSWCYTVTITCVQPITQPDFVLKNIFIQSECNVVGNKCPESYKEDLIISTR